MIYIFMKVTVLVPLSLVLVI